MKLNLAKIAFCRLIRWLNMESNGENVSAKESKKSFGRILLRFASQTSLHGVSSIFSARRRIHSPRLNYLLTLIWTILLLNAWIVCIYQSVSLCQSFRIYSTTTQFSSLVESKQEFPGIF